MKVLVIGDIFLDEYIFGDCNRISPEAPIPIINIDHKKTRHCLGGAANVAANMAGLGSEVILIGRTGIDPDSKIIKKLCEENKVEFIPIFKEKFTPTIKKTRIISQGQQIIRIDSEVIESNRGLISATLWYFNHSIDQIDMVIISDYAKGFISKELVEEIQKITNQKNIPMIVDTKPKNSSFYHGCNFMTPNYKEASEFYSSRHSKAFNTKEELALQLTKDFDTNIIITCGKDGIFYCGKDEQTLYVKSEAKEIVDVCGAGDTTLAGFVYAFLNKYPIEDCIKFANKLGGISVSKQGTYIINKDEIDTEFLSR